MTSPIVNILKTTHVYPYYRVWRDTKDLRSWRVEDANRLVFYKELINPNDLVFDIGANIGNRSKVFLKLGARVVAIEPQMHCAKVLRAALSGNSAFTLLQLAVGEKQGKANLHVGPAHFLATLSENWIRAAGQSGRFNEHNWVRREKVNVTTFDQVISEFGVPDFAKIDVEGFEQQVLSGLTRPVKSGSLEFSAETYDRTIWCLQKLSSLQKYTFQYAAGESMKFEWTHWLDVNEAQSNLEHLSRSEKLAWGDVYFRSCNVSL